MQLELRHFKHRPKEIKKFVTNGGICTGSLTITVGSKVNLKENFHEVVGDIKLQTLSNYKARFLTAVLNRHVKLYGL